MMWFDKADPDAIYMDIREEEFIACDGRRVRVHPDLIADFRNMPFEDESFKLVVFDPPHFNRLGANSYTAQKYGRLFPSWETDLKRGFDECMRVLEPFGIPVLPLLILLVIFGCEINSCYANYFEARGKRMRVNIFKLFAKKTDIIEPEEVDTNDNNDKK